jgi:hypothetical protein
MIQDKGNGKIMLCLVTDVFVRHPTLAALDYHPSATLIATVLGRTK